MSYPPSTGSIVIPTKYTPHRSLVCCTKYKDRCNFQNILQHLDIGDVQKQIIQVRYLNILENFQRRSRNYSYIFFSGHFIITVGSLFVPALLSIQNSDKNYIYIVGQSRLDKISQQFYGTPFFGWLVQQANPQYSGSEWSIPDGAILTIPFPLLTSLQDYNNELNNHFFYYGR